MSTVAENIENPSTRQFVRASSRPRLERNAIAVVSTAMISALLVIAAAAQQTQPQPQQAPTTATVPTSPELAPAIASWQQAVVARLARFQRYPARKVGFLKLRREFSGKEKAADFVGGLIAQRGGY